MAGKAGQGQPLVALAVLLTGWIGLRLLGVGDPAAGPEPAAAGRRFMPHALPVRPGIFAMSLAHVPVRRDRGVRRTPLPAPASDAGTGALAGTVPPAPSELDLPTAPPSAWPVTAAGGPAADPDPGGRGRPQPDLRRWSGDSWLLLREGGGIVPGASFYGASQVGGVLRYRLVPGDRRRLTLYLRGAVALAAAPEQDGAAGISLRPLPRLPVTLGLEGRATRTRFGHRLRAAALVVTELPPLALPLGLVADLYAQGGWISAPDPGLFGDLQLRAERPVVQARRWQGRAGAGLWLGGQRGATRLDLGPALGLTGPVGPASVRLELDWRWRLAGQAAPESGPALVLGTSF